MKEEITFPKMQASIRKSGGLFYQYRPCRREASTIYDIENIRHDVVYARTPLQMNDPYDSSVGFSTEKICDEVIDLAIDASEVNVDDSIKLVLKYLIKYRMLGNVAEFIVALNQLKKYIKRKAAINKVRKEDLLPYIASNHKNLFKDCPREIKKVFDVNAFLIFALVIKDYEEIEIDEKNFVDMLKLEEVIETLEETIEKTKNEVYLPFLRKY